MIDVILIILNVFAIVAIVFSFIHFMEDGIDGWIHAIHIPIIIIIWGICGLFADRPEIEYKHHKIYTVNDGFATPVSILSTKRGKRYVNIMNIIDSVHPVNPEKEVLREIIHGRYICGIYLMVTDRDNVHHYKDDIDTRYEIVPANLSNEQPPPSNSHTAAWLICVYGLMIVPILPIHLWYRKWSFRQEHKNRHCVFCEKKIDQVDDTICLESIMKSGRMHPECAIKFLVKGWDKRLADPDSLKEE